MEFRRMEESFCLIRQTLKKWNLPDGDSKL
jgi:hypothetical protein